MTCYYLEGDSRFGASKCAMMDVSCGVVAQASFGEVLFLAMRGFVENMVCWGCCGIPGDSCVVWFMCGRYCA
jgi:hypothetical protein